MIDPAQLSFQPFWSDRHAFYDLALKYSSGLEIISFAMPEVINTPSLVQEHLSAYKEELPSFGYRKSLHGAFIDITPHSPDKAVRDVSTKRIYESLNIAVELDCSEVIFHTGINPMIRNPDYLPKVIDDQAEFWSEVIRNFPMLTVCLENMWEGDGTAFSKIIEQVGDRRLGMCFDSGHANVFGACSPETWIKDMVPHIPYMHWHDNLGDNDSHLALGDGNIDWKRLISALVLFDQPPTIVLEVGAIEDVSKSLDYLMSSGLMITGQQGAASDGDNVGL